MAKASLDLGLPTYDSIFAKTKSYKESNFKDIPLNLIDEFPNHPYKVRDDENMEMLVDSIRQSGVITPALVRSKSDGRYELISGHRRKHASEVLGLRTLKCEVLDISDEDATIYMVDSNFQRTSILPSEKAFAYKMRLDALKRQGKRVDLTSDPLGPKLEDGQEPTSDPLGPKFHEPPITNRSAMLEPNLKEIQNNIKLDPLGLNLTDIPTMTVSSSLEPKTEEPTSDPLGPKFHEKRSNEELAMETGESTSQIKRYIRLTYLVQGLLEYVDNGKIKLRPAVELSYLDEVSQQNVLDVIRTKGKMPSLSMATQLRKLCVDGSLTHEQIQQVLCEEKPKKEKETFKWSRYDHYFPSNYTVEQKDEIIQQLLSEWHKGLSEN